MLSPRINWMVRLAGALRALGPYAAIELLVPGGTLIALALWVFRNRSALIARARRASDKRPSTEAAAIDLGIADHALPTQTLPSIR
jgi:hypothetical protein